VSKLREIINKTIQLNTAMGKKLLISDVTNILLYLDNISPYPWSPKKCMKIENSTDLEFISKSPEIVEKLCTYLLWFMNQEKIKENIDVSNEPG
jgi:hypothetical protein